MKRRRFGRWTKNARHEVDDVDRERDEQPRLLEQRRPEDGHEAEPGQRQPDPDDDRAVRLHRTARPRTTGLPDSTVARRVRSANGSRIEGRNRLDRQHDVGGEEDREEGAGIAGRL